MPTPAAAAAAMRRREGRTQRASIDPPLEKSRRGCDCCATHPAPRASANRASTFCPTHRGQDKKEKEKGKKSRHTKIRVNFKCNTKEKSTHRGDESQPMRRDANLRRETLSNVAQQRVTVCRQDDFSGRGRHHKRHVERQRGSLRAMTQ